MNERLTIEKIDSLAVKSFKKIRLFKNSRIKRCVIIEDDKLSRISLIRMIEHNFSNKLQIVATTDSYKKGMETILANNPDIIFLDIELPDGNGLNIFNDFPHLKSKIIVNTSNHSYTEMVKTHKSVLLYKPLTVNSIEASLKNLF